MTSGWVRDRDPEDQAAAATKNLLRLLSIPYDDDTIERQLVEAPGYPGAGALAAALLRWGVSSAAVSLELEALDELPLPCLARDPAHRYYVLVAVEPGRGARIVDTAAGPIELDWQAFAARWSGIAVAAEPSTGASARTTRGVEAMRARARHRAFVAVSLLVTIASMLALAVVRGGPREAAALACDLIGLVASLLLFLADLGLERYSRWFCYKARCGKVLRSPAARFGPLRLVDLGVVYFTIRLALGLAAGILGPTDGAPLRSMLAAAALGALPFTLWSVAYQVRLGFYCALCLLASACAWGAAVGGWTALLGPLVVPDAAACAIALGCVVAPIALWASTRVPIERGLQVGPLLRSHGRLRRDPTRIAALLDAAPPSPPPPPAPIELVDGDPEGASVVTVYTDLRGTMCAETCRQLSELAGPGIRVRYRPFVFYPLVPVTQRMTAWLCEQVATGGESDAVQEMFCWFDEVARNGLGRARSTARTPEGRALEERYLAWSRTLGFAAVPVLFLGERRIPDDVVAEDLGPLLRQRAADEA
jgi:uncharacterized membrane protein